jgi:hypothetical protein
MQPADDLAAEAPEAAAPEVAAPGAVQWL